MTEETTLRLPVTNDPCIVYDATRNAFVFLIEDTEVLSLHQNGTVAIQQKEITNDPEAFQALKRFLDAVKTAR